MKKILALMLALLTALLCAAPAFAETGMANPWKEATEEELIQTLGVRFAVPDGAEGVLFRMLESQSLAEMHFTLDGKDYVARIQPADAFTDISGLYYDPWALTDDCAVLGREGKVMLTPDGSRFVGLCLWYDAAPGLMYSLSVHSSCLADLNIQSAAEAMFLPMQGEVGLPFTQEDLHQALVSCTGYAGTAGSSLKNAAAALKLLSFAVDYRLADSDLAGLRETVLAALNLLDEERKSEFAENLASIHALLVPALTGGDAADDLFDSAGVLDAARALLTEKDAFLHWSVLHSLLTGAVG
ncbi:MAG: hypothetical protein IJE08_02860 [Clostridia bacterium]|nr:hypothetical protein [Clostridia bacterium]